MRNETRALVAQMREALAARRAFDVEPECAIHRKLFSDMDEAIEAADKWLASPPTNQCAETSARRPVSAPVYLPCDCSNAPRSSLSDLGGMLHTGAPAVPIEQMSISDPIDVDPLP